MTWSNFKAGQLFSARLAADLSGGTPVKVIGREGNSPLVDAGGGNAYCGVLHIGGKKGGVGCIAVCLGDDLPVIVGQPVTKHQLLMVSGGKFCPRTVDARVFAMALEAGPALVTARLVRHRCINAVPGPLPPASQHIAVTRGIAVSMIVPPSTGGKGTHEYFARDLPEGLSFEGATRTISGAVSLAANAGVTDAWIVAIDEYGQVAETTLVIEVS